MSSRLTPSARRDLIVRAAIPLFARKGFAGTTTREIAEVAGVSEALVFKHFANKTALYDAIVQNFHSANPTFESLRTLAPSTHSLMRLVCVTTQYFATLTDDTDPDSDIAKSRYRMFLRSLSEDGVFAGVGVDAYAAEVRPLFAQFFDAARRAGDLSDTAPDATSAFWIMARQHILLSAWIFLPVNAGADVRIEDYVLFILRGIGLKDGVLNRAIAEDADIRETMTPRERYAVPDRRLAL